MRLSILDILFGEDGLPPIYGEGGVSLELGGGGMGLFPGGPGRELAAAEAVKHEAALRDLRAAHAESLRRGRPSMRKETKGGHIFIFSPQKNRSGPGGVGSAMVEH